MDALGELQQFRAERSENNVLHLVFDMPGRPMNVFSNAAIAELAIFSRWLRDSDVKGVVIRSGKPSAFCAGADLAELGSAYDMIMAAPAETRDRVAFDHFFRLSQALRDIETAGKPVAAAIAGLALGGGGELALATHHRVMVDDPKVAFGLPESARRAVAGGRRNPTAAAPDRNRKGVSDPVARCAAVWAGRESRPAWSINWFPPVKKWRRRNDGCCRTRRRRNPGTGRDGGRPTSMMSLQSSRGSAKAFWPKRLGHYPAPFAILDCVVAGIAAAI